MTATYIIGDARAVIATLPDNSVDLLITSPPFLALRSYLAPDHPDKHLEMGSEPTPGAFIDGLLNVIELADRVLAPHASICIELGDTYAGSGGSGGDYGTKAPGEVPALRVGQPKYNGSALAERRTRNANRPSGERLTVSARRDGIEVPRNLTGGPGWPLDKSLCLIPELFRIALVYGFNPLTGRTTPRWRARNVIRHFRPNPPVGALGDKVRPATSEWVVACKTRRRYFDLDAVRTPADEANKRPSVLKRNGIPGRTDQVMNPLGDDGQRIISNPDGAPPLDWWDDTDLEWRDAAGFIAPTHGYPGAHYATFSPAVIARLIDPMCPRRVCRVCGKPSRRIVDIARMADKNDGTRNKPTGRLNGHDQPPEIGWEMQHTTLGWTDCGHGGDWRPGVVFDPFAGSGTTAVVATGHGRDFVGCDLDARNADLARERVGMFLTVETFDGERPTVDTAVGDAP